MPGSVHLERLIGIGAVLLGLAFCLACIVAGKGLFRTYIPGQSGSISCPRLRADVLSLSIRSTRWCDHVPLVECGHWHRKWLQSAPALSQASLCRPAGWYLAWTSSLRDIQFFQELLGGGNRCAIAASGLESCQVLAPGMPLCPSVHCFMACLHATLARWLLLLAVVSCRRQRKCEPSAAELQAEIARIKVRQIQLSDTSNWCARHLRASRTAGSRCSRAWYLVSDACSQTCGGDSG